jgi:hypothetical protein
VANFTNSALLTGDVSYTAYTACFPLEPSYDVNIQERPLTKLAIRGQTGYRPPFLILHRYLCPPDIIPWLGVLLLKDSNWKWRLSIGSMPWQLYCFSLGNSLRWPQLDRKWRADTRKTMKTLCGRDVSKVGFNILLFGNKRTHGHHPTVPYKATKVGQK